MLLFTDKCIKVSRKDEKIKSNCYTVKKFMAYFLHKKYVINLVYLIYNEKII